MSSVGQQIRDQRLRLGLKLEEISARSRISLKMLQAIEADDLATISSPFLYKSFTRQFADHVKLDYTSLAAALDTVANAMPQPRMPGEEVLGKIHIAPLPIRRHAKSFRWLYSVASFGIMLVACSSVYGLWQNSKPGWLADLGNLIHPLDSKATEKTSAELSPAVPAQPAHSTAPLPLARRAHKASPVSALPATENETVANGQPAAAPAPEPLASPEFRVELSALEPTWLSIVEDGKQTFSGVLDPEQTKVLEGHENARIRTGNAGGLSCIFNGKSIGPLGPRGQVRTVVFTKSNYEVVEAPTPIALAHYPSIVE